MDSLCVRELSLSVRLKVSGLSRSTVNPFSLDANIFDRRHLHLHLTKKTDLCKKIAVSLLIYFLFNHTTGTDFFLCISSTFNNQIAVSSLFVKNVIFI